MIWLDQYVAPMRGADYTTTKILVNPVAIQYATPAELTKRQNPDGTSDKGRVPGFYLYLDMGAEYGSITCVGLLDDLLELVKGTTLAPPQPPQTR